jgi:hypothetical protein
MPVIPAISQAMKIGLNFTPGADPNSVSVIKGTAQAAMSAPALMPGVPPIPVFPVGVAISISMSLVEAIVNYFIKAIEKQAQKISQQYATQYQQALAKREIASNTLYNNLLIAQKKVKDNIVKEQAQIVKLQAEIDATTVIQMTQQSAYNAAIFQYNSDAKAAQAIGDTDGYNKAVENINSLAPWVKQILLLSITIINDQISIREINRNIDQETVLASIAITNTWNDMANTWAPEFSVAAPYYPDLPPLPTLPAIPKMPKEPAIVRVARQMLAKWMCAPMVPPIALVIAGMFEVARQQSPQLPPPMAAQLEAMADAIILQIACCF